MTTELMEHQKLSAIVENYEKAQEEIRQAFDLLVAAKERLTGLFGEYRDEIFPERISDSHLRDTAKECADLVRRNAWRYLLDQMQVWSIMSDSARNHLQSQIKDNKLPEITHENVLGTFQQFYQNVDTLFQDAVKEVFNFLRPRPVEQAQDEQAVYDRPQGHHHLLRQHLRHEPLQRPESSRSRQRVSPS